MMPNPVYLTKTRYAAGLQCMRRLWLNVHEPALRDGPQLGSVEDIGAEIGRMAQRLYPGGVLVDEAPWEHAKAVTRTATLMADGSVPAIFEAAFEHSGVRVRVDVLERLPRGWWGLREVKSSGEVKDHHYDDVAVQLHVLRKAGVRLASVQILHVKKNYVRGQNGIAWPKFFSRVDVKRESKKRLSGIEARIENQLRCLSRTHEPKIEPGAHCYSPYSCDHWEHCTASKPADWVFYMPHLSAARRAELAALEIEAISAIPDDFGLSPRQTVIRDVMRSGEPHVGSDLAERLRGFGPPAFYLDFEAVLPAIPLYAGTRPYEVIPFQWSLHHVDSDGAVGHNEFLGNANTDPRRAFAESLLASLEGTKLPVIVYSSYEQTRLTELAATFPDLAKPIRSVIRQLTDLLPIVRGSVYHPEFDFSSSIKLAAPALCPDVTYGDLEEISDGGAASTAFWLMASGKADPTTSARLQRSLLEYCRRDTWAMVRLHQALKALAAHAAQVSQ
jgi:hypothetical protein